MTRVKFKTTYYHSSEQIVNKYSRKIIAEFLHGRFNYCSLEFVDHCYHGTKSLMPKKIALICFIVVSFFYQCIAFSEATSAIRQSFVPDASNQEFRDEILAYVYDIALRQNNVSPETQLQALDARWNNVYQTTDWSINITLYHQGHVIGKGHTHGSSLTLVLKKATEQALSRLPQKSLKKDTINQYRFKISFDYYPAHIWSFIDYQSKGLELTGERVAQRTLDSQQIQQQILHSQNYLLRAMHPKYYGFFKFYNAIDDKKESLLRTIYSASSLYTLLKLYAINHDANLERLFKPIASFILARQVANGPNAGGFYYGFNPDTHQTICRVVVGTTSKTIFTLLELNHFYPNDTQYLKAAIKAGDWLLTMVKPDGQVTPIARCKQGVWYYDNKQSFLYSGQVLSALSRLYATTKDTRYHAGATKIAKYFLNEIKQQGNLVGDDYRPANSISSSWVMMSLMDFANIDSDPIYLSTIEQIATTILARQITNQDDIYSNGRYLDAMTTSGNGWINEVMGVLYDFCHQHHLSSCKNYQKAMFLSSRWLLQNAYTAQNTFAIKNPEQAIGGFITNFTTKKVRTDAVCHGLNSLIKLLSIIGQDNGQLLNLPERPLPEVLPLLRAGNGFL